MAFTLQAIVGTATLTLNDGNPYSLERADGLGGAEIRRLEESGPYQDGATDLGYRLQPRTVTLALTFYATSAATLDTYRDTLMDHFKPVRGVPIKLRVTRDDGGVRQLDTYRTGPSDIPLVPANRPGNLHRAVIQLRASDPVWYDPTEQEASFVDYGAWWLGLRTIGTANVMEHVDTPAIGQAWAHVGSVAVGGNWSVVFRGARPTVGAGTSAYAFQVQNNEQPALEHFNDSGIYKDYAYGGTEVPDAQSLIASGTNNYFLVMSSGTLSTYRGSVSVYSEYMGSATGAIPGTAANTARWRGDAANTSVFDWGTPLIRAAVYNVALDATQRTGLNQSLTFGSVGGGIVISENVAYDGDVESYPVITITGPIVDPIITNATTGNVLDFTGSTVVAGDTWEIDLRYGNKTIADLAGSSKLNYLSNDSDLATFAIVPSPLATGGTNVISLSGTATSGSTSVTVNYYKRYISF